MLALPALAQQASGPGAAATSGEVSAELGGYGQRSAHASVARDQPGLSLDAALDIVRSSNYRDGSVFLERAASLGGEWKSRQGRYGFSAGKVEQQTRYPAPFNTFAMVLAAWPDDRYRYDVSRASAFVQRYLGNVELGVEATVREKRAATTYANDTGTDVSSYRSRQLQLAPRLRHYGKLGTVGTDTEVGVDLMQWQRRTARVTDDVSSDLTRRQHARALLLREELDFGGVRAPRLLASLRHEQFHLDPADRPAGGSDWEHQRAWDLQASVLLRPDLSAYAKTARNYRIDDDGYTSAGYRPLAGQLRYQREVGLNWSGKDRSASLRLFSERLVTKIVFDPSLVELNQQGYAGNFEPARRDGVAIEASTTLSPALRFEGQLQQAHARYDNYPYDGADIALVPKTLASARLYWTPPGRATADLGVQWLRALRYGNDFGHSCLARVPAFATLDGHYGYKVGAWQLELAASNLANRRHYGAARACRSSIYQNDTRQLRLSARYRF
ncbi:iron complex outermembrane recepter protein [Janthinobacterium psychrotolerans]|uniref:Iron complex outermembrane recepter protein n=2 Tax=Janthinobacterium psychrotolerans TaxID=1747903 RepID=A0A1A7C4H0_9BURK|nr:iron complex outermembrane recepter protein [Janthinobacterium psychrotolerans]